MWTKKFWKATTERIVVGAAVAVSATFFAGDLVFDAMNMSTWKDVGSVAVGGAFSALVFSLAGGWLGAGNGPALTGNEELTPPVT